MTKLSMEVKHPAPPVSYKYGSVEICSHNCLTVTTHIQVLLLVCRSYLCVQSRKRFEKHKELNTLLKFSLLLVQAPGYSPLFLQYLQLVECLSYGNWWRKRLSRLAVHLVKSVSESVLRYKYLQCPTGCPKTLPTEKDT